MKNDNEIWKAIPGFEGLYEASNLGRVKRLNFIDSKIGFVNERISQDFPKEKEMCFNCTMYRGISLKNKEGTYVSKSSHRLIATLFVPNPENKPFVNHINHIKYDNRAENLEWCTGSENAYSYIAYKKKYLVK